MVQSISLFFFSVVFSQLGNYQSGILKKPTNLESYDRLTRKNKNKKDQVRAAV